MEQTLHSVGSPFFYAVFFVAVAVMVIIDMVCLNKQGTHKVSTKEALGWTLVWISVALLFAVWLWWALVSNPAYGAEVAHQKVIEFFTGYIIEKSLSIDNVFVFLMIFTYFNIPPELQRRVLLYGVLGAIVLRVVMVVIGATLVARFAWILYLFGAFLVFTGIKMLLPKRRKQTELGNNAVLLLLRRYLRVTNAVCGEQFFIVRQGIRFATPLFLVLILIELSDVVFAVDSIPAIFAITLDPFIVLTSNIFAILGLRALYFLLVDVAERFHLLRYGLALVLTFIGVKMLMTELVHVPVLTSLLVIFSALVASIAASLLWPQTPALK